MKNFDFENEFKMIYNYSKINEKLSKIYMFLIIECHNYFSKFKH